MKFLSALFALVLLSGISAFAAVESAQYWYNGYFLNIRGYDNPVQRESISFTHDYKQYPPNLFHKDHDHAEMSELLRLRFTSYEPVVIEADHEGGTFTVRSDDWRITVVEDVPTRRLVLTPLRAHDRKESLTDGNIPMLQIHYSGPMTTLRVSQP